MKAVSLEEPLGSRSAQELIGGFVDEIRRLYPTWTPQSGPSAEPSDFEPPGGSFVVLYVKDEPVACGGLKRLDDDAAEIKRLFVRPNVRRLGLGRRVIDDLERIARDRGYRVVRLDTGAGQPQAVRLFEAAGYTRIGDYNGNPFASFWFEKVPVTSGPR